MNEAGQEFRERLGEAVRLARKAGRAVLQVASEGFTQAYKDDESLVTSADYRADEILKSGLSDAFPSDGILSEESGAQALDDSELIWVIDPLDGTKAFAKRIPGFSIMIGLLRESTPVLGVVYEPLDDRLYFAVKDGGAFFVRKEDAELSKLTVSTRRQPSEMPLITSMRPPAKVISRVNEGFNFSTHIRINSVGVKVGLLVRQEGDVYFVHHGLSYWDTVAPLLIALEAGAKATFLDGRSFFYDLDSGEFHHEGPSLITNATCHDELVEGFAAALRP